MRGTVFRVSLPLVMQGQVSGFERPDRTALPLRGRVALVVENDPDMRRGYEMILRDRLGMVVRVTGGTAEALATMGDDPPDVILADYHLENGDTGVDAIRALRGSVGQAIPAVMVTAHRDPQIARNCAAMQVHLMEKPVHPAELAEVLADILA